MKKTVSILLISILAVSSAIGVSAATVSTDTEPQTTAVATDSTKPQTTAVETDNKKPQTIGEETDNTTEVQFVEDSKSTDNETDPEYINSVDYVEGTLVTKDGKTVHYLTDPNASEEDSFSDIMLTEE